MIRKIKSFFKDEHGFGVDIYIMILTFAIGFLILIDMILPAFVIRARIQAYTKTVVRDIEIQGEIDTYVQQNINVYNAEIITPTSCSYSGTEFIYGTKKIQLNDKIVLKCYKEYDVEIYGFNIFTLDLASNLVQGRSSVYWKD